MIRHKRDRQKAAELREAIVEGYQDAISRRTKVFSGNLKADLKAHRKKAS
jgi:ribosome modulation factor